MSGNVVHHFHRYLYISHCWLIFENETFQFENEKCVNPHIYTYSYQVFCQYGSNYPNSTNECFLYTTEHWERPRERRFPWELLSDVMEAPRA